MPRTTIENALALRVTALESELARMRHRIECLRGGLKSAAGWLLDADDMAGHEKCIEMAGDMEPPLMVSNAEVRGDAPLYGAASLSTAGLGNGGGNLPPPLEGQK